MWLSRTLSQGCIRRCPLPLTQQKRIAIRQTRSSSGDANGFSEDETRELFGLPIKKPPPALTEALEEISVRPEMENRIQMTAFLAKDPEFYEFRTGTYKTVLSIGLLSQRTRRKQWFEAHVWGPLALVVKEHLSKGEEIYLQGKLQQEMWSDAATGRHRSKVTILAQNIKKVRYPVSHVFPEHLKTKKTDSGTETSSETEEEAIEDTVNPYDISSDEEGNLRMPPAVKEIIWNPPFPEMPQMEWLDYVNALDIEDMWKLLFQRPKEFWDGRSKKHRRKRDPCFRHLLTDRSLFLNRKTTPDWVRFNIKFLGTTALFDI